MSAIAYFLESEGLQTTGISLVRENTQALKPPRFLWTTFPLGRPLGVPNDPAFQRRVILAALALLDRAYGPVLEDYPEDAPLVATEDSPVCPVSFARPPPTADTWAGRLRGELALLKPWYDLSLRRRGRTTVGLVKAPIDTVADQLAAALDTGLPDRPGLRPLKYAMEDLKAWYQEALTAQPGTHDPGEIQRVLWRETELGRAILATARQIAHHPDPKLRPFARGLAPRFATEE